ncbi:eCIS core domain-containing protein [Mycobacterium sp.]|uniref:eCIS core domain-containing protein n=1 Tax=Mycobacterium sp. TaxID=1785 RepID=UPI003F950D53
MFVLKSAPPGTTAAAESTTSVMERSRRSGRRLHSSALERAIVFQRTDGSHSTRSNPTNLVDHEVTNHVGYFSGLAGSSYGGALPFLRPSLSVAHAGKIRGPVQAKLAVGKVDDPFEREADRVADQVMRMPAVGPSARQSLVGGAVVRRTGAACDASRDGEDGTPRQADGSARGELSAKPIARQRLDRSAVAEVAQRDIGKDEVQEQLVKAFLNAQDTLQRQAAGPLPDDDIETGERILMQAKLAGPEPGRLDAHLESGIQSMEGQGEPLQPAMRNDMEGRFGHDFSRVRVHADASAARLARRINARAFTIGRNVVFADGEYAPNGGADSRRLLAHELTHVIQQGQAGQQLQRKISVAGKDYTPSARYLSWLNTKFGPAMREFVEHMHNGGSPPVFSFSSFEQMGFEVRIRSNALKGMDQVNANPGCCGYFSDADPPYLDSTYWDQVGSGVDFKLKSPLPPGKHPSDAIEAIFSPTAHTRLECLSMTLAIEYYSMLKAIGAAKFDAQFAGGIEISTNATPLTSGGPGKKYDIVAVSSKSEILPGDWVYFKNFHDYLTRVPTGYWQGENAIYMGGGMYRGFGVATMSENDLDQELVNQYNNGASPALSKTVPDLIADGGGVLLDPVIRPITAKIAP